MTITYYFYLDLDNDDIFESGENITDYIIQAEWTIGLSAWKPIANRGELNLVLNNADKRFSPDYTSSPYYPNLLPMRSVRVVCNDGTDDYIMWTGFIVNVRVDAGVYGERRAYIRAFDFMDFMRNKNLGELALQRDVRADEIIRAVLDKYIKSTWLLGIEDRAELGETTYLGGPRFADDRLTNWKIGISGRSEIGITTIIGAAVGDSKYSQLQEGVETFSYAGGDWFAENTVIGNVISDATRSEGWPARFFFDRRGRAVFWDRQYLQSLNTTPSTIDADVTMMGMSYMHGGDIVNEVVMEMNPRTEGAAGSVLYSHQADPFKLGATNGKRTINAPFVDADNNRVGATLVIPLQIGIDYTLNTAQDSSGDTYTTGVTATVIPYGDRADVSFLNNNDVDLYVCDLQLRGTPLQHFNPMSVNARNGASVSDYGLRSMLFKAPLLEDVDVGFNIAKFIVAQRGQARGVVASLFFQAHDATTIDYALSNTIGDLITLSETQTSVSSRYVIVGERHQISANKNHTVTWIIEPNRDYQAWLLGVAGHAELGQTTYLGY